MALCYKQETIHSFIHSRVRLLHAEAQVAMAAFLQRRALSALASSISTRCWSSAACNPYLQRCEIVSKQKLCIAVHTVEKTSAGVGSIRRFTGEASLLQSLRQFAAAPAEAYDINSRTKPHLNIGTIGHVDHGKTTADGSHYKGVWRGYPPLLFGGYSVLVACTFRYQVRKLPPGAGRGGQCEGSRI